MKKKKPKKELVWNLLRVLRMWGGALLDWLIGAVLSFPLPIFERKPATFRDPGLHHIFAPGENPVDVATRIVEYHIVSMVESIYGRVPSDNEIRSSIEVKQVRFGADNKMMNIFSWMGRPLLLSNLTTEWAKGNLQILVIRHPNDDEGDSTHPPQPHPTSSPS